MPRRMRPEQTKADEPSGNPDPPPLFSANEWRRLGRALGLTDRQVCVAQLICAECTVSDMAGRLGRSADTVSSHLRAIYERLGVRTRVGVVVRLVEAQRRLRVRRAPRNPS